MLMSAIIKRMGLGRKDREYKRIIKKKISKFFTFPYLGKAAVIFLKSDTYLP